MPLLNKINSFLTFNFNNSIESKYGMIYIIYNIHYTGCPVLFILHTLGGGGGGGGTSLIFL